MPSARFWAMVGVIGRMEASESVRNLEVAFYAANPGKDGIGLRDFQTGLLAQANGDKAGSNPAFAGMPTSALSGPMVSQTEGDILLERLERGHKQIEDQQAAWQSGGWLALQQMLAEQRAVNLAAP